MKTDHHGVRKRVIVITTFYSLNMKCPPQAHVLIAWSPASGVISESSGNLGGVA
jgi:hypothetical protein